MDRTGHRAGRRPARAGAAGAGRRPAGRPGRPDVTFEITREFSLRRANNAVAVIAAVALVMAFVFRREVLAASEGTPNMQVIARGVPFLEAREKNHFIRVDEHEWQMALEALAAGRTA